MFVAYHFQQFFFQHKTFKYDYHKNNQSKHSTQYIKCSDWTIWSKSTELIPKHFIMVMPDLVVEEARILESGYCRQLIGVKIKGDWAWLSG